ncbi:MAG: hypothetical protein QM539_05200 [Alphaproteobacteria bacterium]|nr:hypothetical protein [Alphaproteobacteria bacterium]
MLLYFKRFKLKVFYTSVFYFTFIQVIAQGFGGHPPKINIKSLKSNYSQVIFKASIEPFGNKISQYIQQLAEKDSNNIYGYKRKKPVDVVLLTFPTHSNGYVTLAPFNAQFFLSQPRNPFTLGASRFEHLLTTHEYRHVQQFKALDRSWVKLGSIIAGDYGRSGILFYVAPNWYFEGDAVTQETWYSDFGRGNLPLFFAGFKSLYQNQKNYSFRLLRNGSFKKFVPNHYNLGYLLVNYGYEKYGADFWQKMTFQMPRSIINRSIKKVSGESFKSYIKNTFNYFQNQWQDQDTAMTYISPLQKNNVFDYYLPYTYNDSTLIILKHSYDKIPRFVFFNIRTGKETTIIERNYVVDNYYSFNQHKIVYNVYNQHKRWSNKQFSDIYVYDIKTQKGRQITKDSTYFSPDIAHNTATYLALDFDRQHKSSIVWLDSNGCHRSVYSKYPQELYYYPKFSKNDSFCFASVSDGEHMKLVKYNLYQNWKYDVIIPYRKSVIGFLSVQGDSLWFTTTYQGRDELWLYNDKTHQVLRIATYPTGVYQSAQVGSKLISSIFTYQGHRLALPTIINQVPKIEDELKPLYLHSSLASFHQKNLGFNADSLNGKLKKYHLSSGWFNLHSWTIFADAANVFTTLYTQNSLNTVVSRASYTYNYYEQYHQFQYSVIYGGKYIEPFFNITPIFHRTYNSQTLQFNYNQFNVNAGVEIPLAWVKGKYIKNFSVNGQIGFNAIKGIGNGIQYLQDVEKYSATFTTRVFYSRNQYLASQNLAPRFGESYNFTLQKGITNTTINDFQINANLSFNLPGIGKNHNLNLRFHTQLRDTVLSNLNFSNQFVFARGYLNLPVLPIMVTTNLNYQLPIAYPDWGTELFYLNRIRLNIYYDASILRSVSAAKNYYYNSVGAELLFDIKLYGSSIVPIGVGYSRLLNASNNPSPNYFYLLLPFSNISDLFY